MDLFYRSYGEQGPALVIVHGLYGTGDNWVSIAREMAAAGFRVFVVDQRNHGRSAHEPVHDYPAMRDDLIGFLDARGLDRAILLGHSMGGKAVMQLALDHPGRVEALISVDMAPRSYLEPAHFNGATNHAKMIDAMLALDLSAIQSRSDADRALRTAIGSERVRSFMLKNLSRTKEGGFRWRLNLEALRSNLPAILDGLDTAAIEAAGGLTEFPVLFMAGEHSDYILPEDHIPIRRLFPEASIVRIPSAGHWVHAEQPRLLIKSLRYFLEH